MALANGENHEKRTADRSHSLYTVIKRLCHALVVAGVVAMTIMLIVLLQQYQNEWLKVQTQFSGESVARQYAKLLENPLSNYVNAQSISTQSTGTKNSANQSTADTTRDSAIAITNIENVLKVLTSEPHIINLAVFNSDGKYIAPLPKIPSVIELSKSDTLTPLTFVEDIHNEDGILLGYVNIHMNTNVVLENPLTLRSQLLFILLILLGLALILGVYMTRAFYKSRPWIIARLGQK
jgi:membrane protein